MQVGRRQSKRTGCVEEVLASLSATSLQNWACLANTISLHGNNWQREYLIGREQHQSLGHLLL